MVSPTAVPDTSFLSAYAKRGAFTDCYAVMVAGSVSLPQFIEAFYTTRLFKVERWILAKVLHLPSTDAQAGELAAARTATFAAWRVEHRADGEILLDAGQTRSWLSVVPASATGASTALLFGSAVVPIRPGGKFGLTFHALLGFNRLYSKLLLSAAARRVRVMRAVRSTA